MSDDLDKDALPPVLFDMDDIEHVVLWRGARREREWRSRVIQLAKFPALVWGERRGFGWRREPSFVPNWIASILPHDGKRPRVVTIPNAVQIPEEQPVTEEPNLLFIGSYLYQPNIDAAEFLIHRVWPLVCRRIRRRSTDHRRGTSKQDKRLCAAPRGVTFTGFVDDVADLYRRARVVCAPILTGGGTRVKIIEAGAYGKPVVSTRIGAEGLEMHDGQELMIRDDAESFAERVSSCCRTSAL